jgi:RNA polymerase sigma-70 factor (ECF subfamily)
MMDDGIKNVTDFQRLEGFSLDALRQGDRAEFARLVESYSDTIYRVAMKMLENEQDAEDVLQETFIKAYRGLKNFDGRSRLSTWLYRIATNEALMVLRRSQKVTVSIDEPINEDEDLAEPRQIIDWCCLPEDELMTSETRQHLDHAIDSLPPSLRVVFVLRDLEGLSTAEAGEVLNLSETAVKTRLSRARLRLRESLSGYFSGTGRLQPVAREGDA